MGLIFLKMKGAIIMVIENIVTTHDEIYKAMIRPIDTSPAAKEVVDYNKLEQ